MYKSSLEYPGRRTKSTEKKFAKPEKRIIVYHFTNVYTSVIMFLQKFKNLSQKNK